MQEFSNECEEDIVRLEWEPIANTSGYFIEVIYTNEDQCRDPETDQVSTFIDEVDNQTFSYEIPREPGYCVSYRIGRLCEDSDEIIWTDTQCASCNITEPSCETTPVQVISNECEEDIAA